MADHTHTCLASKSGLAQLKEAGYTILASVYQQFVAPLVWCEMSTQSLQTQTVLLLHGGTETN